jgi:hypothetical protein
MHLSSFLLEITSFTLHVRELPRSENLEAKEEETGQSFSSA